MNDLAGAESPALAPDLVVFIQSLLANGRAIVSARPLGADSDEVMPQLLEVDTAARAEFVLDLPALSEPAVRWSARMLYQLCQFVVLRDLGEAQIDAACTVPCPAERCPEIDWSVDLLFRHLPKVFQLARHLSNGDPLVRHLQSLGQAWPLSSVGIPDLNGFHLESFIRHPALRRLYTDRIIAANDQSRLGDPQLDEWLRADLGVYRTLAPGLAAKLFTDTP